MVDLRAQFHRVILTDASMMVGMTQAMRRRDLVPAAIAAGCDERLHDAVIRILALEASLGLHTIPRDELVPSTDALSVIGSAEHHAIAADIADKTVTLVKDTQQNLPLTPDTRKRIRLYGISGRAVTVEKIQGLSEYTSTFNEKVWCDTFGTRL
ncbi:beta-glucosidase-like glycosyl hydrolase [Mycetocola sp. CAN_C7]|uniref:hypothetical protein n=1 Tax=Mycetocola sp. CAN_C7 TaxID=2787724 RepID=UPI001A305373